MSCLPQGRPQRVYLRPPMCALRRARRLSLRTTLQLVLCHLHPTTAHIRTLDGSVGYRSSAGGCCRSASTPVPSPAPTVLLPASSARNGCSHARLWSLQSCRPHGREIVYPARMHCTMSGMGRTMTPPSSVHTSPAPSSTSGSSGPDSPYLSSVTLLRDLECRSLPVRLRAGSQLVMLIFGSRVLFLRS
jgi:hypothetical protein